MNQTQAYRITNGWSAGYVDCEVEHDGREPDEDREPSLAAPERHPSANGFYSNPGESQIGWAAGLLQLKR